MNRLLQKGIALIIASAIVCCMLPMIGAFAEDKGDEYFYFNNFENYEGGIPDGFSDRFLAGSAKTLSAYEDAERGKVMKQLNNTDNVIFFGQMFKSGNMHISFDYKMEGEGFKILPKIFDSMDSEGTDTTIVATQYYAKIAKIDRLTDTSVDELSVYSGNGHSWGYQTTDPYKLDGSAWHRVDIVMNDLGKSTTGMDLYIDGVKYTNDKVLVPWGVKAFSIRTEGITGVTAKNAALYLDNLSIRRTFKTNQLFVDNVGEKRVALENGKLNVAVSEPVNTDMISSSDITIKNKLNGQEITNYTISNSSNTGFDVDFSGAISPGKYTLRLSDEIKGLITDCGQTENLEFSTASRTENLDVEYINLNFNNYTAEGGSLPDGFINQENMTFTPSAVAGETSGDKALGFENVNIDRVNFRNTYRYIYDLTGNTIPEGSEYDISFDVKASKLDWFVMLLEEDDLNTETNGYKNNVAIGIRDTATGSMGYADTRRSGVNKDIDEGLTAAPGEWNNIKLRVVPTKSGKCNYIVSVNDSDEYTVTASRDFMDKETFGFGFGYSVKEDGASFAIDNIKISQQLPVVYPEVNDVKLYDCYDMVIEGGSSTSMIKKAVIEFDSVADEASAAQKLTITNGDKTIIPNISSEVIDDKTYLTAEFPELAEGGSFVTVFVDKGVMSGISSSIRSELDFTYTIKTDADTGIKIISRGVDAEGESYDLTIAKNNTAEVQYTIAVCGYKNITVGDKTVPQLVGMTYIPVSFGENEKGVYNYSKPVDFLGDYEYTKELVFSYPASKLINVDENGNIK